MNSTTKKSNKKNNKRVLWWFFLTQSYDCEGSFPIYYGLTPDFFKCLRRRTLEIRVCLPGEALRGRGSRAAQLVTTGRQFLSSSRAVHTGVLAAKEGTP